MVAKKKTLLRRLNNKIVATGLKADSLPLIQLKYSLNNFCSQRETNDMRNRFATSIL